MLHYAMRLRVLHNLEFREIWNHETNTFIMQKYILGDSPDLYITELEIKTLPLGQFWEKVGIKDLEHWNRLCDEANQLTASITTGKVYVSRRNLLTLLSKLDRKKVGEATACTLIKVNNKPSYQNTLKETALIAVDDEQYYQEAAPGMVHPSDDPNRN